MHFCILKAQVGSTRFASTHNKSSDSLDLMDGTNLEQPRGTLFDHNVVREVGVFGKQTSAFVQMLSCNTTIQNSVMFNGPRAGINFNDGKLDSSAVHCSVPSASLTLRTQLKKTPKLRIKLRMVYFPKRVRGRQHHPGLLDVQLGPGNVRPREL